MATNAAKKAAESKPAEDKAVETAATEKKTRVIRTPEQRAQDEFNGVVKRLTSKLGQREPLAAKLDKLDTTISDLTEELDFRARRADAEVPAELVAQLAAAGFVEADEDDYEVAEVSEVSDEDAEMEAAREAAAYHEDI